MTSWWVGLTSDGIFLSNERHNSRKSSTWMKNVFSYR
jgi:hypothetical protein